MSDFFEMGLLCISLIDLSSRFNTPSCFSLPDSSSCVAQVPEQDVFIFRDFFAYFRNIFYHSLLVKKCSVPWRTTQWQPDRASSSGTTAVPAWLMCAQVNIWKLHQTQPAPTPTVRRLDPNCPQKWIHRCNCFSGGDLEECVGRENIAKCGILRTACLGSVGPCSVLLITTSQQNIISISQIIQTWIWLF